ncbi:ABC transporter substrate-binding protein [Pararhizobium gei]|uniref:ABC transporter substrate-binding protein n=1 Tax=Pararhizobium gei TaxID=1395951 RepID=UPI0023DAB0AB|nr:ABC transporter substrate-binding protein [Rhizobium gei]
MKNLSKISILAGAIAMTALGAVHAETRKAEVMHWWTTGSEAAALKTLVDAYNKAGGEWVDHAVPDYESALAAATSAIVGGSPPAALQFIGGKQFTDLAAQDYLTDLTPYAEAGKWADALPPAFMSAVTYDNKVYAIPIDNHGVNWMWSSTSALKKAGVTLPTKWDEFFPMLDKIKAAGITPVAQSGEPWVQLEVFYQLMMFRGDLDLYYAIFRDGNVDVVKSPEFKAFAEDLRKYTTYMDAGSAGLKWNDATSMVIKGTAAVQFMGDWAKGEFTAAGLKPGVDYDCTIGFGGKDYYIMSSDVFVLPKSASAEMAPVHKLLAETMMSPEVQVAFNNLKGGLPARLDADPSSFDACAAKGFAAMKNPEQQVAGIEMMTSSDRVGAVQDAVIQFWNTPSMTSDDFVAALAQAIETTE